VTTSRSIRRQRGASMIEFTIVAPILTLIGLLVIQWALTFHARNVIQHASFMAARAGSTAGAQLPAIEEAYTRALAPLYGGGRGLIEIETSVLRARADLAGQLRIEVLNPTRESFTDWHDPVLAQRLGLDRRVIPNEGLALRADHPVGAASGQTLADANVLKLRITQGVELDVPLAADLIRFVLRWRDDGRDAFVSALIAGGRLPMHVDATLHMQSAAIEQDATIAVAGRAHAGEGREASDLSQRGDEPDCVTVACSVTAPAGSSSGGPGGAGGSGGSGQSGGSGAAPAPLTPADPGGGGGAGGGACTRTDGTCPFCPA
jgi:uncharacterized membrane protein YgcG